MTAIHIPITDELVTALAERVAVLVGDRLQPVPWLTVAEAATYLGCPVSRLYALKSAGRIPHHKEGTRLLFHRDELDSWVRAGGGLRP